MQMCGQNTDKLQVATFLVMFSLGAHLNALQTCHARLEAIMIAKTTEFAHSASKDFIARTPTQACTPPLRALQVNTAIQQGFQCSVEIARRDHTLAEALPLLLARPVPRVSIATPLALRLLVLVATAV